LSCNTSRSFSPKSEEEFPRYFLPDQTVLFSPNIFRQTRLSPAVWAPLPPPRDVTHNPPLNVVHFVFSSSRGFFFSPNAGNLLLRNGSCPRGVSHLAISPPHPSSCTPPNLFSPSKIKLRPLPCWDQGKSDRFFSRRCHPLRSPQTHSYYFRVPSRFFGWALHGGAILFGDGTISPKACAFFSTLTKWWGSSPGRCVGISPPLVHSPPRSPGFPPDRSVRLVPDRPMILFSMGGCGKTAFSHHCQILAPFPPPPPIFVFGRPASFPPKTHPPPGNWL